MPIGSIIITVLFVIGVVALARFIILSITDTKSFGIFELFNKQRRDTFSNIKKSTLTHTIEWRIQDDWGSNGCTMFSTANDLKVHFGQNTLFIDKTTGSYNTSKINMTFLEKIKMKRCYKRLLKYDNNKATNEELDELYVASTGYKEL